MWEWNVDHKDDKTLLLFWQISYKTVTLKLGDSVYIYGCQYIVAMLIKVLNHIKM